MTDQTTTPKPKWLSWNNLGMFLLIMILAASLIQIARTQEQMDPAGKVTIRIGFWQLEGGYREAMRQMIDDYEKVRPGVHVVMMPITEKLYSQWLNVHLINGDAPDLCEMGNGNAGASLTNNDGYKVRYFWGMSGWLQDPNPYNKGTRLANVPWRETFIDGMKGQFTESLQEYYAVPMSFFGTGIYYNKEMVTTAVAEAGLTDVHVPPQTYGELIKVCEAIKAYGKKRGVTIAPMVTCYKASWGALLFENYIVGFTAPLEKEADTNLDGQIDQEESYAAYVRGPARLDTPRMRALFETYKALMPEYAEGIMAMDRSEATRKFAQQETAMIMTGSWDTGTLLATAKGHFTVATMRYPMPVAGEKIKIDGKEIDLGDSPEPGGDPYVVGRMNSASATGGAGYGIFKYTPHVDEALDFLRFLSSQAQNEKFNRISTWAPAVVGAHPSELTKPFMPDPEGYTSRLKWDFNGTLIGEFDGKLTQFLTGETTYAEFVKAWDASLANKSYGGDVAWAKGYENEQMNVKNDERAMAAHATAALLAGGKDDDSIVAEEMRKYYGIMLQQVRKNDGEEHAYRYKLLTKHDLPQR